MSAVVKQKTLSKTTTKVDVDLLRKARLVAIYRNVDLFDYLEGLLRPLVDVDYARMFRNEATKEGN